VLSIISKFLSAETFKKIRSVNESQKKVLNSTAMPIHNRYNHVNYNKSIQGVFLIYKTSKLKKYMTKFLVQKYIHQKEKFHNTVNFICCIS